MNDEKGDNQTSMKQPFSFQFISTIVGAFIFLLAGLLAYVTSFLDADQIIILFLLPAFILLWHPIVKIFQSSKISVQP